VKRSRIGILDGFRAAAILAVVFYHYFSNPYARAYPYGKQYDYFKFGYLGVHFFFIISGFVISYTLINTDNWITFWKKRWIRLFPSMLAASCIIYFFFLFVSDKSICPGSHSPANFLPALTFLHPDFYTKLFSGCSNIKFGYLSGSFWTLWTEIQFYLLASGIYFLNRQEFVRNFILFATVVISANWLMGNIIGSNTLQITISRNVLDFYKIWVQQIFNLSAYLIYFCMGVLFHQLYQNKLNNSRLSWFIKTAFILFFLYFLYAGVQWEVRFYLCLMALLFAGFIYFPSLLSVFESRYMVITGAASYFIYLIHEPLGMALLYAYGTGIHPYGLLLPLMIIAGMICTGILYTEKVDKKISACLKRLLLKPAN
jgi:peptidoglycan/LPS O-acetylase OafA/YrhL